MSYSFYTSLVLEATHRETVRPIIVIQRVNLRTINVHIVAVSRRRRRRPVVPVRPLIVVAGRRVIAVT
jgi:hypothetical protein